MDSVQRSGKGADKECAEEGDIKHNWEEEESDKSSWRRGHLSFLIKDGGIWPSGKGVSGKALQAEGIACGEWRQEWAWRDSLNKIIIIIKGDWRMFEGVR